MKKKRNLQTTKEKIRKEKDGIKDESRRKTRKTD